MRDYSKLNTYGMTDVGYRIFIDRYSQKDSQKGYFELGDIAVVVVDKKTGNREVGTVSAINFGCDIITVTLADGTQVTEDAWKCDKPLELNPADMWKRVAIGIAHAETPEKRLEIQKEFEWLLEDFRFVPGGRILTAAGTNQNLTSMNCFVIPSPVDSRSGIMKTAMDMIEIMSRGGGVGINVSSIRPRYDRVEGVNGRSSGSVSWASLYSFLTGLIEQAGSRRGALMLQLGVWHPDIEEFITSKTVAGKITNANISVAITDDFMAAVKNDNDWELVFPIKNTADYSKWDGRIDKWKAAGGKVRVYKTLPARELWSLIIKSAWASAEPGLWFIDRTNKLSNSFYYDDGYLCSTNPCAEQPLPAYGACNLGAINLAKFVKDGAIDWDSLDKAVGLAVRFLDNVIVQSFYPSDEIRNQETEERRLGLGVMGLAELLFKIGVKYGSPKSLDVINDLFGYIALVAYATSSSLAIEKGSFDRFNPNIIASGFLNQEIDHDDYLQRIRHLIDKRGLRNVTLLTIAPTGSTATMVNTSTGVEPFYYKEWERHTRLGSFTEKASVVADWERSNPGVLLPDYFVTAMDLSPEEHVRVQAVAQKWIDSAISKTCNVPNEYTVEQVADLYMLMYDLGCKGGTVYRDGSRSVQVLETKKEEQKKDLDIEITLDGVSIGRTSIKDLPRHEPHIYIDPTLLDTPDYLDTIVTSKAQPVERTMNNFPKKRSGQTISVGTPAGTAHITGNSVDGQPMELFVAVGKAGTDVAAFSEALGRLVSYSLKLDSSVPRTERVREIIEQLEGIGGANSFGFGPNKILSVPDAVAKGMREIYLTEDASLILEIKKEIVNSVNDKVVSPVSKSGQTPKRVGNLCKPCGNYSVVREDNCERCLNCGNSKC